MEIVVERKQLPPTTQKCIADDTLVPVQIAYGARELGKMARLAGGNWDSDVKLWYVRFGNVKGTELEKHIILDAGLKQGGT